VKLYTRVNEIIEERAKKAVAKKWWNWFLYYCVLI
jgi:hypothetical protein